MFATLVRYGNKSVGYKDAGTTPTILLMIHLFGGRTMTNEPIALEFANKLSDHLGAQRVYYKSTAGWKADKVVSILLVAFGSVLVAKEGLQWWSLIWFALGVAEWFNLLSIHGVRTRMAFNSNPKFRETYGLSFSDAGVQFKTVSIDSKLAWSHYTKVLEGPTVVLLVYGRWMYTVIPKSAFRDEAQLAAFIDLVNRHVGVVANPPPTPCSKQPGLSANK